MISRRLPVYLVLDTSGSMSGAPIDAVREGIRLLVSQLRRDPQALETVHVSVITFDSNARQVVPLTGLESFVEPTLNANGSTSLAKRCRCSAVQLMPKFGSPRPTKKEIGSHSSS